ncbi:MAG TPA: V-type ATP synthase subunit F [Spirochaetota bacterium]|nr:V-type ATP synthase subunit F [Spirochaetota bacterium]HPJ38838.1 V-type ATP synthase subunit F [Spirochaetota bacterium]HPQ52978.1 V-type ATP synthase subunit F [Spirochaetota bacterium]
MEKIYIMGDIHTVTAFSFSGITGVVVEPDTVETSFKDLLEQEDAGIIMITHDLSQPISNIIYDVNLNSAKPVIIEIPGIDAPEGIRRSVLQYISEALGVSV